MPTTAHALERRLLLAILGGGATLVPMLACRKDLPTQPPPTPDAAPIAVKPPAPAPETAPVVAEPAPPTPDAAAVVPATPSTQARARPKLCTQAYEKEEEMCREPFAKHARSQGTGEPAPPPPPSAYDKNGCLPKTEVSTGCCNPGVEGPRFKNGKCCYTVCTGACCGRPFLVGGRPRAAEVAFDGVSAWVAPDEPVGVDLALDPATRAALAGAWLADARMEHASAAAFGRFVLQLISVGAPADLVERAAEAAADEVRHARLCFGLAARYSGALARPLPLPLDGVLASRTLAEIVTEVAAEGCVGETIAALVAARALEGAEDERVREALERIAEDEARHAELAWSFVRWALANGGEEVHTAARAAFARAASTAYLAPPDGSVDRVAWRSHGRLAQRELVETASQALGAVVLPCAGVLLGERAPAEVLS